MAKNVSVLFDDEDVTYLEENKRKKIKVDHLKKFKAIYEYPGENLKEIGEIIT